MRNVDSLLTHTMGFSFCYSNINYVTFLTMHTYFLSFKFQNNYNLGHFKKMLSLVVLHFLYCSVYIHSVSIHSNTFISFDRKGILLLLSSNKSIYFHFWIYIVQIGNNLVNNCSNIIFFYYYWFPIFVYIILVIVVMILAVECRISFFCHA